MARSPFDCKGRLDERTKKNTSEIEKEEKVTLKYWNVKKGNRKRKKERKEERKEERELTLSPTQNKTGPCIQSNKSVEVFSEKVALTPLGMTGVSRISSQKFFRRIFLNDK